MDQPRFQSPVLKTGECYFGLAALFSGFRNRDKEVFIDFKTFIFVVVDGGVSGKRI